MQPEIKPFYLSRTVIVNAIIAAAAFYPPAREYFQANPELTLSAIGAIGVFLRFITRGRVVLQ